MSIDPALLEYIHQTLDQGFSVEEVRQTLVETGWDASTVNEALETVTTPLPLPTPTTPVASLSPDHLSSSLVETVHTPAQKSPRSKHFKFARFPRLSRRAGLTIALVLVIVLGTSGGAVVLAESGYAPSFSRLYRRTSLPLLWHGTAGTPEIAVLQIIQATSKIPAIQNHSSFSLSINKKEADQPVALNQWPAIAQLFTTPPKKYASINTQLTCTESEECTSTTTTTNQSTSSSIDLYGTTPDQFLPFNLSGTQDVSVDPNQAAYVKTDLDLTKVIKKLESFQTQLPGLKDHLTFEGSIIPDKSSAYLRSSLIPYLDSKDQDKWLAFALPTDFMDAYKEGANTKNVETNYNSEELATYRSILSSILKDQGIVRRDNKPYALYHMEVTPEIIKNLEKNYSSNKNQLSFETNYTIKGDFWVDTHTSLIAHSAISIDSDYGSTANLTLHVSTESDTTYSTSPITAPPTNDIIAEDGLTYLEKVSEKLFGNLTSNAAALTGQVPSN